MQYISHGNIRKNNLTVEMFINSIKFFCFIKNDEL